MEIYLDGNSILELGKIKEYSEGRNIGLYVCKNLE